MYPRENQIQANQSLIQITPCAQTTILFCTSHTKGRVYVNLEEMMSVWLNTSSWRIGDQKNKHLKKDEVMKGKLIKTCKAMKHKRIHSVLYQKP